MRNAGLVAWAAVCTAIIGMMLVIAGVITSGLFLPGVIIIGLAMLGFAGAGVIAALDATRAAGAGAAATNAGRPATRG